MTNQQQLMSLRIDEARDRDALAQLDRELSTRDEPWARSLRLKIGMRMFALRKSNSATPSRWGAPYGLPSPDGRWLYRYRLGDDAFCRLQEDVAKAGKHSALEAGWTPALFVLWASEWFRRSYRGEGHEWEKLTHALGCSVEQSTLRSITKRGLEQWGREVRSGDHGRYFLATLAREGGFPVAAVEEGGKGWAREVIGAIIVPLLAEPVGGIDRARDLAAKQSARLPRIFQDDEFMELCADLALAVVELRRAADGPALAAGLPAAAWLEQNYPDWRDQLPLAMGSNAADALVGGLLSLEAESVSGAAVGVERLLVRSVDGRWCQAARLALDGQIDGAVMRGIEERDGRLRAFAAGEFARAAPGELAMIEPPSHGESAWLARGTKRSKGIIQVPFASAIELDLRSGERRVARIALPGGKPRRGRLLVCTVADCEQDQPRLLKVEGAGSGAYRASEVILQAPTDWRVDAVSDEEVVEPVGKGAGNTLLWRVRGGAMVTDPNGDCYRIRTGQARDRRDAIELVGSRPAWCAVTGDIDLFSGPPLVQISDQARGGLYLRAIGSRDWMRAPRPLPIGHYELGWRDNRLMLDRRRIAVLPSDATLTRTAMGRDTRFELSGWGECSLELLENAPVISSQDGRAWMSRPVGFPTHWFNAQIGWPDGPSLIVRVEYPTEAGLARWDGTMLPGGTQVTLHELRDLVAVDRGTMRLFAELVDRRGGGGSTTMTWSFDHEMPLSSVAGDIASLLLPASIDAEVKLGMLDGVETYWHVGQFEVRLTFEAGGLIASKAVVSPEAELCGRSFSDPAVETSFGPYSLFVDANHRPAPLPSEISGEWLVYLRDRGSILSRPLIVKALGSPSGRTALTRAMARPPWDGLDEELDRVLADATRDDDDAIAIIKELNALVASLNGLPPATFRALELVAQRPAVLTMMAVLASPEEREAVLALSDALPFAWCVLPRPCWEAAQATAFRQLLAKLADLKDGPLYAKQALDKVIEALIQREPLLQSVLKPAPIDLSLKEVAQTFLNRAVDRVSGHGSRYRRVLGPILSPYFLQLPSHCLETLDAPCAAALAVAEKWVPRAEDIRHMKAVARNFPTFFADAFAVSLQEHAFG